MVNMAAKAWYVMVGHGHLKRQIIQGIVVASVVNGTKFVQIHILIHVFVWHFILTRKPHLIRHLCHRPDFLPLILLHFLQP